MAALVRGSNTQLLMYSLDVHVSYSMYLPTFESQEPSLEFLEVI